MSILSPEAVGNTYPSDIDPSEISHGVCACQMEATPRLALCGYDCTDDSEAVVVTTVCVVCEDIIRRREPCRLCGGLD